MPLTPEQAAVVAATGRVVRVRAYAGTGKTSTLVAWAQRHPRQRIFYAAFNKSVQLAAQRRFPRHVTVKTWHALAWQAVGAPYQAKLVATLSPWHVVQAGGLTRVPAGYEVAWADLVVRTLIQFLASADPVPDRTHVPGTPQDWQGPWAWADPVAVVRDAQRLWQRMCDPTDPAIGMVHDGYLKLFALRQPRLPFDAILFDEAQDANPAMLHLMRQQDHVQQLYVGDPFQSLYAWRGAVNALETLVPDTDLRLTASFRFGPVLAAAATRILQWFDSTLPPLRGLASHPGRIRSGGLPPPITLVARTNARLLAAAIAILERDPSAALAWVGGIDGYRLDAVLNTYRFFRGDPVRDPFLQLFPDFDTLEAYADAVNDVEWQGRIHLVKRWRGRLPGWIRRIHDASRHPAQASVRLATVHKAKGLEWPHVVILDDLADLSVAGPDLDPADQRLWYVAVTRATDTVAVPPAVLPILSITP